LSGRFEISEAINILKERSVEPGDYYNFIENLMKTFHELNDNERVNFLNQYKGKNNFLFDFFNLYTFFRLKSMTKYGKPIYSGLDYLQIKSNLIKKYNLNDKDDYISLDQLSKMNLQERMEYKNHQLQVNSMNNIYDDLMSYMNIKGISGSQVEKAYNEMILNEVNEAIINQIFNNKEIYTGVVIVKKERLESLFNNLIQYINLI
jgi:hypothetical protein